LLLTSLAVASAAPAAAAPSLPKLVPPRPKAPPVAVPPPALSPPGPAHRLSRGPTLSPKPALPTRAPHQATETSTPKASSTAAKGPTPKGPAGKGLAVTGLAGTGPAVTGPARKGLAGTGLAANGSAAKRHAAEERVAQTEPAGPGAVKAKRSAAKALALLTHAAAAPSAPSSPAPAPTAPAQNALAATTTPVASPLPSTIGATTTTAGTTGPATRKRATPGRTSARGALPRASAPARPLHVVTPVGTSASVSSGTVPAAGARHSTRASGSATSKQPRTQQSSPAIRTIERLVGVIPRWIWSAIGVLIVLSLVLSGGSLSAVARARRVERQRRRLAADVGLLQGALLPAVPELIGGAHTSAAYRPAEGPAAGGDFYDVWELGDGRVAAMVGDVSGHGRAALPQTALIRYTLRAYLDAGMAPRKALGAGAAALDRQLQASFTTVVLAIYDPRESTLTYSCAGHPPPVVLGTRTVEPVLECCSPPVGTGSATGLRETTLQLPGRAQVCFFTDGVVEARTEGDLFGVDRLTLALGQLGDAATAQSLLDEVVARSDRRPDDMAACLLAVPGGERAPSLRAEEVELRGEQTDWQGPRQLLAGCGVDAIRIHAAIGEARSTIAREGAAVLRLRLDGPAPAVEVAAPDVRLTPQDDDGAESALAGR
jgi:Stage II sporulation protein E (SpoIIE)